MMAATSLSIRLRCLGGGSNETIVLAAAQAARRGSHKGVSSPSGPVQIRSLSTTPASNSKSPAAAPAGSGSSTTTQSSSDVAEVSKSSRKLIPSHHHHMADMDDVSPVQRYLTKLRKMDRFAVAGTTADLADPVLPENPAEIALLAPAQARAGQLSHLPNGDRRIVNITQHTYVPTQMAKKQEAIWHIQFDYENEDALGWTNELMGWRSGSDPLAMTMPEQLMFPNALAAVEFCQKNGWDYIVEKPIRRAFRRDGAQYQDNFLPQFVAYRVKTEGKRCDQWKRAYSGASHYQRPLNYHGNGLVQQYGPNPQEPTAPHKEGSYKIR